MRMENRNKEALNSVMRVNNKFIFIADFVSIAVNSMP